jgi:outer membrane lipoprotein SlyB
MKHFVQILALFSFFLLAACAPDLSSSTYNAGQVGVANETVTGTIISKRVVRIDNNSKMGGMVGAAGGAVAGSFIGGDTRTNLLGGLGGAVVGGLVGNAVDKKMHAQQGYEYIIRVNKQKTISVTQTMESDFAIGQRVMVIYGDHVRIISDNSR